MLSWPYLFERRTIKKAAYGNAPTRLQYRCERGTRRAGAAIQPLAGQGLHTRRWLRSLEAVLASQGPETNQPQPNEAAQHTMQMLDGDLDRPLGTLGDSGC
jgi:hypothetical protein